MGRKGVILLLYAVLALCWLEVGIVIYENLAQDLGPTGRLMGYALLVINFALILLNARYVRLISKGKIEPVDLNLPAKIFTILTLGVIIFSLFLISLQLG